MNTVAQQKGGVLFIAPSAYPLGGVAVWLNYLVPGLRSRGVRALAGLVEGRWHDAEVYRACYPALPAIAIGNRSGSREGRIRAIERAVNSQQPDIVVASNIADVYPAVRRLRERGDPVRVVMALHAIAADLLDDLRHESGLVDAVIVTNKLAAKLCIEHSGLPAERVMYAPCGVDESGHAVPADTPSGSGVLRVVWVGRIEQSQKRSGDLAALMAQLDAAGLDIELTIVGDGPDRQALGDALDPWTRTGRVRLLGALSPAEVATRVYAQADVLLITSEWETGPIVLWEAMSAGVAVVTSRYIGSGLEGALQHERNCLMFPIGDMSRAAQCLLALAGSRHLREDLVRSGRELVRHRYTIAKSVETWAACLDAVAKLPAKLAPPSRHVSSAGRLDHLLGPSIAESARSLLGIRFEHSNAGGEWPHTRHTADDEELLALAATLDSMEQR